MKHPYFLGFFLLLGIGCGLNNTPVKLEEFCTSRYQKYSVNKVPLGDKAIELCLNEMKICTEQELGRELNNYRSYLPYCYYLEGFKQCESACEELGKKISQLSN